MANPIMQVIKWAEKVAVQVGENVVEKELHLYMDGDTPIEVVKEFALRLIKRAGQIEDHVKAQQAAQEAESKKDESAPEAQVEA